ncbi:MAG TPA: hypothetical protein VHT91_27800 [Kofleriaceae bacterium]|jgi:hypothetical protein|nr:hypothetical protein [Kofleriaceae bacterium]
MSIDLPCDWKSGFLMDPTSKQRCGYLTAFNGLDLGTEPTKDAEEYKISVFTPFNAEAPEYTQVAPTQNDDGLRTIECIGIIDHLSWGGGAGDPICIGCYVSTEFANQLKAKQKTTLTTTAIKKLGWWIVNYDVENKAWFEEGFPKTSDGFVAGQLNAQGGKSVALQVADEPTVISANIDVQVFQVYFEIVPGANATYALRFAQGKTKPFVKGWGLQVGKIAKDKLAS